MQNHNGTTELILGAYIAHNLFNPQATTPPTTSSNNQPIQASLDKKLIEDKFSGLKTSYLKIDGEIILRANIDVGFGHTLYISGAHENLGNWKSALPLQIKNRTTWDFKLTHESNNTEYKFLIGRSSNHSMKSTEDLVWEPGNNRSLDIPFPAPQKNQSCCFVM